MGSASCCWWLIWSIQNDAKNLKNDWNPGIWVLIWEHSTRAIQWIPTWQGLDGFLKSLCPCAMNKSSLSIGNLGINAFRWIQGLDGLLKSLCPCALNRSSLRIGSFKVNYGHEWVNPSNAEATFIQRTMMQRFWKPSKPCHLGNHWEALVEYSQIDTHAPAGFSH